MSERRHQHVVDKFQHKFAKRISMYWLIYTLTLFNVLFCWQLLKQGPGNVVSQYIQFVGEFYPILLCFFALAPFFIWDSVKFYHRIAGPVYHFRKVANEVSLNRPVRRIKLRETDELTDMQEAFNTMLESLAQRGVVTLLDDDTTSPRDGSSRGVDDPDRGSNEEENIHVPS